MKKIFITLLIVTSSILAQAGSLANECKGNGKIANLKEDLVAQSSEDRDKPTVADAPSPIADVTDKLIKSIETYCADIGNAENQE